MTPTNPPTNNLSPAPKPTQPLWQRVAMAILGIAVALYLIFGVALPNHRARQAELDGPAPQATAPAH